MNLMKKIIIYIYMKSYLLWGLGIGDWGLAQAPIPNPQSPIPNPHISINFII